MRMIKTDMNATYFKRSSNIILLDEFINGDMDIVEIVDYTCSKASICATSLNNSIKRYGYNGIRARLFKGKVYLVKE